MVGVDGSQVSARVLRWAAKFAGMRGAPLQAVIARGVQCGQQAVACPGGAHLTGS